MVHGCGDLSGFTSDKLSSQSKICHLAFIRLFAREENRSKYITGANRFTIIHVTVRWHHNLYLCHCMKLEVNNINTFIRFVEKFSPRMHHKYPRPVRFVGYSLPAFSIIAPRNIIAHPGPLCGPVCGLIILVGAIDVGIEGYYPPPSVHTIYIPNGRELKKHT